MKKNIIFLFLMFISFFGFSQYPIKTVFKGDSVVIMTTDQFEGIDLMISNQRNKSEKYKENIKELEKNNQTLKDINDTLIVGSRKDSIIIDSLKVRLKTIETWIMERSIDNAWIYYNWMDSSIACIDLSRYAFYGNRRTGRFILFRRSGSIGNPDLDFWNLTNRQYPQFFEKDWDSYFKKKIRPNVIKYPFKVVTPYKPQELIEIKLSE